MLACLLLLLLLLLLLVNLPLFPLLLLQPLGLRIISSLPAREGG